MVSSIALLTEAIQQSPPTDSTTEPLGGAASLTRDNVIAVVVTYHPDAAVILRLRAMRLQFSHVVIIDNHSNDDAATALRALAGSEPRIGLIENRENLGVGAALNLGCRWAAEQGAGWVAMFDQDSVPSPHLLMTVAADACQLVSGRLGLIGVNYIGSTGKSLVGEGSGLVETPTVITSGTLLNLAAWRAVGPFREDYFIDEIDHEYAFRLRKAGWSVRRTRRVLMRHQLGASRMHQVVAGARIAVTHHSALRRYYMVRNRVLLAKAYLAFDIPYFWRRFVESVGEAAGVLLFEIDKLAKLRAMGAGLFDGLRGRTGRAD